MKKSILIDVDDCILDVTRRKRAIFSILLGRRITIKEIIGKRTVEVLINYLPKEKVSEYRHKFWSIALCVDPIGKEFIHLDRPVPFSRRILRILSRKYEIFYITNRIASMHEITLNTLKKFGFPFYWNLISADDYTFLKSENGRKTVIAKLPKDREYIAVVDDLPENYTYYKQMNIPEIIGFMKYIVLDERKFLENGATYVMSDWREFPLDRLLT
ncbi:MAG TPA: hypothetical protein VKU94_04045 [Geobacterales bacterium]|nr:hypothetical protein [Geobacterales bacterium]